MPAIAVLYATREGHTRAIAERIGKTLRAHGLAADVLDVTEAHDRFSLEPYQGVVLAASVHAGKHEDEMVTFVARHTAELARLTTAFISVSLSAAGAEHASSADARERSAAEVTRTLEEFYARTGFHPTRTKAVAGALAYSRYSFFVKLMMKRLAQAQGMPTDTSHDYAYTDWAALDRFVLAFASDIFAQGRFASVSANVVS